MPVARKDAFKTPLGQGGAIESSRRAPGASACGEVPRQHIAAWSAYLREQARRQDCTKRIAGHSEREPEINRLSRRQRELWREIKELETRIENLQRLRRYRQVLKTLASGGDSLTGPHTDLTELISNLSRTLDQLEVTSRPLLVAKTAPIDQKALRSHLQELSDGPHLPKLQLLLDTCKATVSLHMALKAIVEELTSLEALVRKMKQSQLYLEYACAINPALQPF